LLQVKIPVRPTEGISPSSAFPHQDNHGDVTNKFDDSKHDPSGLQSKLDSEWDSVEAHTETEDLTTKVQDCSRLSSLARIALKEC
jgi:hypothetical protein